MVASMVELTVVDKVVLKVDRKDELLVVLMVHSLVEMRVVKMVDMKDLIKVVDLV